MQETISLTFGDCGENHVGMKKIGTLVDKNLGFNLNDLNDYKYLFESLGGNCNIYNIKDSINDTLTSEILETIDDAYVMVVKNGLNLLLKNESNIDNLLSELNSFEWDKKYFDTRRNKVLNKRARSNVCFGDESIEPDYENKIGRVVSYNQIPSLNIIKNNITKLLGNKCNNLICEGNRYFDLKKCGIGFHGDSERRKVIAFRIGHEMDLHYKWFYKGNHIGNPLKLTLNNGDMYIMSEKAVGNDWKKRNIYTLRHAAGIKNSKYLK